MAGFAARGSTPSDGSADDLLASLIVLSKGGLSVAWLAVDIVAVTLELADQLRNAVREGLADSGVEVVVSASHTHSAPSTWVGSFYPGHHGSVNDSDVSELLNRTRELARAIADVPSVEVNAAWTQARVEGFGANRLDPSGPYDGEVGVLVLRDVGDDAVRAAVFDTANHPTVLGSKSFKYSADWPGAARRLLRDALCTINAGAGSANRLPTVAFLQGAAGDISPRFVRRGTGIQEVTRLGTIAAKAATAAVQRDAHHLEGAMRFASRVLSLPLRALPDTTDAEEQLVAAVEDVEMLSALPAEHPQVRVAQSRVDGARVQLALVQADLPATIELPLCAVILGDVAWVHLPVELFTVIARRIRETSPYPITRVIGYSNDYCGYLVDECAHRLGTYEALTTLFAADADEELVSTVQQLLKELRDAS